MRRELLFVITIYLIIGFFEEEKTTELTGLKISHLIEVKSTIPISRLSIPIFFGQRFSPIFPSFHLVMETNMGIKMN